MASPSIPIPGAACPTPDVRDGSDEAGSASASDASSDTADDNGGRGDAEGAVAAAASAAAAGGAPFAMGRRRSAGRPPRPPASPDEVTAAAAAAAAAMNDGLSLLAAASVDADGGGGEEELVSAAGGNGSGGGRVDAAAAAAAAVDLSAHFLALGRGLTPTVVTAASGSTTSDAHTGGASGGGSPPPPTPPQVTRLVLTGGPCAGKTTALATLSERLRARGFAVYVVPEAATIFWTGGASLAGASPEQVAVFQASLLRVQLALEDAFVALARAGSRPAVLLADRGALDGRAYMGARAWDDMMRAGGWSTAALRDGRYDGVVHLVTAADGAIAAYGSATNATRVESPAEAVALDAKLRACWVGHPALRVVDNTGGGGFAAKMERVHRVVCGMVGVPASATCRRKFLVVREGNVPLSAMAGVADFDVIQTFLSPPSAAAAGDGAAAATTSPATAAAADGGGAWQESVRQRGRDGYYTFVHKVRRAAAPAAGDPPGAHAVEELKRAVGNRDYLSLLARADPSRRSVRLRRRCFLHAANYYVLDAIERSAGEPPLLLLRVAVEGGGGGGGDAAAVSADGAAAGAEGWDNAPPRLDLPPWLHIGAEVTGDPAYSVYELSRRLGRERRLFAGRPLKGGGGRGGEGLLDLGTSV